MPHVRPRQRPRSLVARIHLRTPVAELLEDRHMLHGLSTGFGDGSVSLDVDGYGSFSGATYDPIGAILAADTTFESMLAIRIGTTGERTYLTTRGLFGETPLPEPTISGTTTTAFSTFSFGSLNFELTQIVSQLFDTANVQTGSVLTQRYAISNASESNQSFEFVRYFDGDLLFDGTIADGGGKLILANGREFLFETDAGGTGATDTTFVGIDTAGGTVPITGRFEIDQFAELRTRIGNGAALGDRVVGDTNGDGFIENGQEYDVTLALRNLFTVAPGGSAAYTTRTVFGSGVPVDIPIDDPLVSVSDASVFEGSSGLSDLVFTISVSKNPSSPVVVGYATENESAIAPGDYLAQAGTITFAPGGPLTQTVTIQAVGDTTSEFNETFRMVLRDATSGVLDRSVGIGRILNDDVDVIVNDISIMEGNSGTKDAVFTISTAGDLNQEVVVAYTTVSQTAVGNADFLPRGGTVTLTAANSTARVTVPVVGDLSDEIDETFGLLLTSVTNGRLGDALGIATIIDNDLPPGFYVDDVQVTTTVAGARVAVFTVALDWPSGREVSVAYATADGGAQAGVEYQGMSGVLNFTPGERTKQVVVPITTSADYSSNKKFYLTLGNASNASLIDPQGACTLVYAAEPVGEQTIDNGAPGYSRSFYGWETLTNTIAHQLDYDYHAPGDGSGTASWTFAALPAGSYEVLARWIPFNNRATNAPFTILDGSTTLATVLVNQQLAPTGDQSNGITWQSLGRFEVIGNTLTVRLTDNANGLVVADAVRLVSGAIAPPVTEMDVSSLERSIDQGDDTPSFDDGTEFGTAALYTDSIPHTFTISNHANADLMLTGSPRVIITGANAADFQVTLQPSATVGPGKTSNFQIVFHPLAAGVRTAVVSIANSDDSENPYTFTIQGTTAEDSPGVALLDNTMPGFAKSGTWSYTTHAQAYLGEFQKAVAGNGASSAKWQFGGLTSGTYFVYTSWAASPEQASNAPFTVSDGGVGGQTIYLNQQQAPGTLLAGRHWGSLGAINIATGMLTVDLTNAANGAIVADAVMIVRMGAEIPAAPLVHNAALPQDVNADGKVSVGDLLVIVNSLLRTAAPLAASSAASVSQPYYMDVTNDGRVSSSDVVSVVNYLLRSGAAPTATPLSASGVTADAVDQALVLLDGSAEPAAEPCTPAVVIAAAKDQAWRASEGAAALPFDWELTDLADDEDDDNEASDNEGSDNED